MRDVEYESSEPHSEKLIPAVAEKSSSRKQPALKVKYIGSLTMEEKVDLTLKLVIVLIALNVVLILQGLF